MIPTIISQLLAGKKSVRLGNLDATRDMNYVLNTCEGFHHVGLHERSTGEVINLGSNREISIKDLAQLIASLMNKELKIEIDDQRIRPERARSKDSSAIAQSKRADRLGAEYTLEEGLKETIAWLEDHMENYKPDIYNL